MTIEFEWDAAKAKTNFGKHRVSFEEATSAFYDKLSISIPDPDHSVNESRFLLIGITTTRRFVVVAQPIAVGGYVSSMRGGRPARNEQAMKKSDIDLMRSEYDFSGGVRGKYLPRLANGANVVVLDRDIAKVFPTSKSVNDALRVIAEAGKRHGKATSSPRSA
ncbi:MAG TPA: BrnT family toxin [Steroidobacteraceae bacterium]|nr:BrnT family toxin [Steroidobacteraceae bacterium]